MKSSAEEIRDRDPLVYRSLELASENGKHFHFNEVSGDICNMRFRLDNDTIQLDGTEQ